MSYPYFQKLGTDHALTTCLPEQLYQHNPGIKAVGENEHKHDIKGCRWRCRGFDMRGPQRRSQQAPDTRRWPEHRSFIPLACSQRAICRQVQSLRPAGNARLWRPPEPAGQTLAHALSPGVRRRGRSPGGLPRHASPVGACPRPVMGRSVVRHRHGGGGSVIPREP